MIELREGMQFRMPNGITAIVAPSTLGGVEWELVSPGGWARWLILPDGSLEAFHGKGSIGRRLVAPMPWTVNDLTPVAPRGSCTADPRIETRPAGRDRGYETRG